MQQDTVDAAIILTSIAAAALNALFSRADAERDAVRLSLTLREIAPSQLTFAEASPIVVL